MPRGFFLADLRVRFFAAFLGVFVAAFFAAFFAGGCASIFGSLSVIDSEGMVVASLVAYCFGVISLRIVGVAS